MFLEEAADNLRIIGIFRICRTSFRGYTGYRNFHVFSYRLSGEASFRQEADGRTFHVANGDILHLPANIEYRQSSPEETLIAVHVEIPGSAERQISVFSGGKPELLDRLFLRLYAEWTEQRPGYRLYCQSIFCEILADAARQTAYRDERRTVQDSVQEVFRYLDAHFMEPQLTVSVLAEQANISEVYFRKQFQRVTGITPVRYIFMRRLRYAQELLSSGYFSVAETAEQSGFSDAKYFSTAFHRETGQTPSQFRAAQNGLKGKSAPVNQSRKKRG